MEHTNIYLQQFYDTCSSDNFFSQFPTKNVIPNFNLRPKNYIQSYIRKKKTPLLQH